MSPPPSLVCLLCLVSGILQLLLQLLHPLLVQQRPVLQHLPHTLCTPADYQCMYRA